MNIEKHTKIIIIGANGFIGHALLQTYQRMGCDVIGYVRGNDNIDKSVKRVDFKDVEHLANEFCKDSPDIIFHCAGAANVTDSVKEPLYDYESNVSLTYNILLAVVRARLENVKFVFLSSAAIYGNTRCLPIVETQEPNPLSPYALHKLMCENLCYYFNANYGLGIKIARIFSAYGPGLKKQVFWDMYQKYSKDHEIRLWGRGDESRDYIYIDDLIKALILIADDNSSEIVYNVANGYDISISELAKAFMIKLGGDTGAVLFNGIENEGAPRNWVADISKISGLGYKQEIVMETGIEKYIEWIKVLRL